MTSTKRNADLTVSELATLPERERAAVARLLREIESGRTHAATSYNDLTAAELADEYEAGDRQGYECSAFPTLDAKAIKAFLESGCQYKSSRWNNLKSAAYTGGCRLAAHHGMPRPSTAQELAALALRRGVTVDLDARTRKLQARAARVAVRQVLAQ